MQITELFTRLQPSLSEFMESGDVQLVCRFTGAKDLTVKRWVASKNPARGENEIRLWHLLLAAGYEFDDLRIDEFNFYLSELLAYSIITMEKAMQIGGVKNSQTALQIMRGQPPMHPAASLTELREQYDDQLQEAKRSLQQDLRVIDTSVLPPLPRASAKAPAFDALVPALANMLKALAPIATLALDEWTPEQRSEVREQVGDQLMFTLSNDLNALCSERARANQGRR